MKQAQTRTARLRRANCATLREERREFLGVVLIPSFSGLS